MTPTEQFLSTLPQATVVQALQSLLPAMLSHWDQPEAFHRAATPRFMHHAGISRTDAAKAVAVVAQALKQVVRMHTTHFRPFANDDDLEYAYTRIVPSSADSPSMQGSLWLAFQAQKKAIDYLDSEEGKAAMATVVNAVFANKEVFKALGAGSEGLTLAKIERILNTIARRALDDSASNFELTAIAGYIIELGRREARGKGREKALANRATRLNEELRMLATVIEPVHKAELNEANQRFMRLSAIEKGRRFDRLRQYLNRRAKEVGELAPRGFEKFCHAVENKLFPYPAQIEWMRSYLKPLYTNAEQSSIFDNCISEASIRQRYEKVMSEKNVNATLVEMARAFSQATADRLDDPAQREFLEQLNLRAEFNWPSTLAQLHAKGRV